MDLLPQGTACRDSQYSDCKPMIPTLRQDYTRRYSSVRTDLLHLNITCLYSPSMSTPACSRQPFTQLRHHVHNRLITTSWCVYIHCTIDTSNVGPFFMYRCSTSKRTHCERQTTVFMCLRAGKYANRPSISRELPEDAIAIENSAFYPRVLIVIVVVAFLALLYACKPLRTGRYNKSDSRDLIQSSLDTKRLLVGIDL